MDLELGAIEVPRAADVLAERLRSRILSGDLPVGTHLPAERILAEQSGLSRSSVRQALRALEVEGLAETKQGRNGGTRVRRPDGTSVTRSLTSFIRGRRIRFRSLLEIRELIEPECAALAAERSEPEDVDRLNEISQRLRAQSADIPAYLTANVEWHLAIAEASRNELLAAFMEAISTEIRAATDLAGLNSTEIIDEALRAHDRILEAIADHEPEAARRRMKRHVCAYRDVVSHEFQ